MVRSLSRISPKSLMTSRRWKSKARLMCKLAACLPLKIPQTSRFMVTGALLRQVVLCRRKALSALLLAVVVCRLCQANPSSTMLVSMAVQLIWLLPPNLKSMEDLKSTTELFGRVHQIIFTQSKVITIETLKVAPSTGTYLVSWSLRVVIRTSLMDYSAV